MNSSDVELPSYAEAHAISVSSAQPPGEVLLMEHTFMLNNSNGKPWLTLTVFSRAPSPKKLPIFLEGDAIRGKVKVEPGKEKFKSVIVAVLAENTAVGQEPVPFLHLTIPLLSPPSPSRLSETVSWPFTLTLPEETLTSASPKDPLRNYPLPPTFSERASPAYVDYKIIVTVKKGSILKVKQTLSTSFVYVPRWTAPPPPPLRRAAYADGSPLVGPEGDPEGWFVLPSVKMTGMLFDSKSVVIDATLALAKPLSYATGSPIPLVLILASTDTQVLDLFSQLLAPSVFLTRTISIGSTAEDDTAPRRSNNTFPERVSRAFWWPSKEGAPESGSRVLQGELDVGRVLKPGFMLPRLAIRYHINMSFFSVTGFVPSISADQPLISQKVSIVTQNAPGILPRSHAPPGYVKPPEGNYNNSMGYLENGNQRFYHHHGFA